MWQRGLGAILRRIGDRLRHIDTQDEMSTLGQTNNAPFFPYLKVVRLIATQGAAPVDPPITMVGSLVQLEFPASTCGSRKRCLTNWGIEEHEFWLLDLSNCSNGSCLWRTFAVYLQTELNDERRSSLGQR
jgi:hypothetical protein